MKCLQFGGLLDFYGEVFSSRRRPHRAESAYFQGKAFRHSFWHFLVRVRKRLADGGRPRHRMKPYAYRAPMCRLSSDEIGPHARDRKARRWHRHLG
jgi:hypothetical protein